MFTRAATFLLLAAVCCLAQQPASVVCVTRDAKSVKDYKTNPAVVHAMVDQLIIAITGQPDVAKAWTSLVAPSDRVGIKICAAGGELFTTHRDVVNAIVDGLVAAGHSRNSIIVWDRSLGGAVDAGYKASNEGYQLRAIAPGDGYDRNAAFTAPLLGKLIWGDLDYKPTKGQPLLSDTENTSSESHFCRIVSSEVTKIINVPVMSDSATNGIAGCLYNVTIPDVDNWRRFAQATGFAASGIPEIYSNPLTAGKVVVNIMDGLIAEYAGGPASQPNYSVHYGTLLASKDPVAVDAVALRQLEEWRKRDSLPAIGPLATHVQVAAQMGIGNADPSRIAVKKIAR
ncbi:MAG: DUF362 domain-containing protein [Chthoniobacterales bacterium]